MDRAPRALTDSRLANISANAILEGYEAFQEHFRQITVRARLRFARQDWRGLQADAGERLDQYKLHVDAVLRQLGDILEGRVSDKLIWAGMKAVYSGLIARRQDWELAETFFNSITRRVFSTVGVDPQIEFVDTDFDTPPLPPAQPVFQRFGRQQSTQALIEAILGAYDLGVGLEDACADAVLAAERIDARLRELAALQTIERAELLHPVFYRGQRAFLIGRLYSGTHLIPLALALSFAPGAAAARLDAILLDEDDISILFSFTRAYFLVDTERPHDLVAFLRTIMPRKKLAELYISIGYNKHGKTELYRDLLHHLQQTDDVFEVARGERGMVMAVFTLPSYDLVFKVIKDRFGFPKNTSRAEVKAKYRLVFRHDRAGRLIDAQEFEHWQFSKQRFDPALLDELQQTAASSVHVNGASVDIRHLYVERRLTPLDVYIREADPQAVRRAVVDYGYAIKDLASTGIFPGDILLKNFGVTRHGRVVFYDYDELCMLSECNFRRMPQARSHEQEMSAEPWFFVDEMDIFPEEFATFLGLTGELRQVFTAQHADLFDPAFWQGWQARLLAGEVPDVLPYHPARQLHLSDSSARS